MFTAHEVIVNSTHALIQFRLFPWTPFAKRGISCGLPRMMFPWTPFASLDVDPRMIQETVFP